MKKEYDFSQAVRGKFYRHDKQAKIVVHLKKNTKHTRFEIYEDPSGLFHFRLQDDRHTVFASQSFESKEACLEALSELKQSSIIAPTVFA
ncbi:YegP family protein [Spirochaeta lutea]|uniref:DUF1508 domain-containing protein n=1 Tax=Spirochaeta lutea TaxID=1480694 RepID=A0A098QY88_9SPIO|nr:hypothetical protein [Spirochaeta lutea]KGE72805.1 hypothetical protein DC28_06160 [Spirochaeta lutea]